VPGKLAARYGQQPEVCDRRREPRAADGQLPHHRGRVRLAVGGEGDRELGGASAVEEA
jgi:hypothetical protein